MTEWLLALLFILWAAIVVFLRAYRIWLLYYLVGAVGLAYWLVLVAANVLRLEPLLAHSVAWTVHGVCNFIHIPTRVFENAPGVLLVLVIIQPVGWTVLHVGVESSGLLEISVLVSLLLFYPSWSLRRRGAVVLLGALITWVANVLRMLAIVVMLHYLGKEALVLAHTYVGRAFFFVLMIGIFWLLVTFPTLRDLRGKWTQPNPAEQR